VFARIELTGPAAAGARAPRRARVLERKPGALVLCVPADGSGALRKVDLPLRFRALPQTPPPETFGAPWSPGKALQLSAMSAAAGGCEQAQQQGS
jgi:hypothetical protein